jgi:hypothetical protein
MKLSILALLSVLSLISLSAQAASYTLDCVSAPVELKGNIVTVSSLKSTKASGSLQTLTADGVVQRDFTGTVAVQSFADDKFAQRTKIEIWTDVQTKPLYALSVLIKEYADGTTEKTAFIAVDQQPYQTECSVIEN